MWRNGILVLFAAVSAGAQTGPDAPAFEVASVKRSAGPAGMPPGMPVGMPSTMMEAMRIKGGPGTKDPGRIDYQAISLKSLLVRAYGVRPEQISGPGWMGSEMYDIVAKVPPGTDAEKLRLMLQGLLTERFQIVMHREKKVMPVYVLTQGKNGHKLQAPDAPKEYKDDAQREAASRAGLAAMMAKMRARGGGSSRSFHLASATTAKFAESLSTHLDHPVRDKTGLDGVYSFNLEWSPDTGRPVVDDAQAGTSVFAAVEEQLGLKLRADKEEMELLVIEKIEKTPIEN